MDGVNGIVRFLKEKALTDESGNLMYKCTDPSRKVFKMMNNDGKEIKDVYAAKLLEILRPLFTQKTQYVFRKQNDELVHYQKKLDQASPMDEDYDFLVGAVRKHKMYADCAAELLNELDNPDSHKLVNELVRHLCQ